MTKKNKKHKRNSTKSRTSMKVPEKSFKYPLLTSKLKRWIGMVVLFLVAVVLSFSFFEKAGSGGTLIFKSFHFVIGKTIFFLPFFLLLGGFLIWRPQRKRVIAPVFLGLFILILGVAGILATQDISKKQGGWLGYVVAWPLFHYFDITVTLIIFSGFTLIGALILWEFLPKGRFLAKQGISRPSPFTKQPKATVEEKVAKVERTGGPEARKESPEFEIKAIEIPRRKEEAALASERRIGEPPLPEFPKEVGMKYSRPPLDLLDQKEEQPSSGDTEYGVLVIKKTLRNFGIEVEMSEVNIGPTVTQYTLKPAEGVKLSRIVSLNNDLALALAAHPIRIEAPIPGRSLVGIEVPNRVRAVVKIGSLIGLPQFQKSSFPLTLVLGKDVMGRPIYADLERMPHLLIAGSTGAGKTICLNSFIVSLIFRNSPKILKLILIDPKRVEFPVYEEMPHLLTPVIFHSQKAVNVLNWLVKEMERRFEVLQEARARDIVSYNRSLTERAKKQEREFAMMPYIILIIDELADLMAAKGREVEASIVRLSQLARAVGIHLIVATQRPSVEVITGLIKANITSRIAFQVASQVDSRTILDIAGAEKLLGRGDMLFLSSEFSKPKRVQGSFITTAEIKRVVNFIKKGNIAEEKGIKEGDLSQGLQDIGLQDISEEGGSEDSLEDPLYDEAKKIVIEYRKASASLLQRRLKIGYARAARLLDILEERGVVGPQDGAKPREVYLRTQKENDGFEDASKIEFEYK